jgi:hypothetical protein
MRLLGPTRSVCQYFSGEEDHILRESFCFEWEMPTGVQTMPKSAVGGGHDVGFNIGKRGQVDILSCSL